MTRSLLRDLTPARRPSAPAERPRSEPRPASYAEGRSELYAEARSASYAEGRSASYAEGRSELSSESADGVAPIVSSGARTNLLMVEEVARAAAMLEIPPMFRADGAPMPAFRFPDAAGPSAHDLASVVGGHTMTGHQVASESGRSSRGTVAILGIAAMIGIGAAVAFHLKPTATEAAPAAAADERRADRREPLPPPTVTPPAATPTVAVQPTFPKPANPPPSTATPPPAPEPTAAIAPTPPPTAPTPPDPSGKPAGTERPPGVAAGRTLATPPPSPVRPAIRKEPGFLRVHTTPWAWAMVGNEKQDTPAAKFKLAPGRYTVRLNFPTLGITETHQVTIEPQKTFTLNINKEEE